MHEYKPKYCELQVDSLEAKLDIGRSSLSLGSTGHQTVKLFKTF